MTGNERKESEEGRSREIGAGRRQGKCGSSSGGEEEKKGGYFIVCSDCPPKEDLPFHVFDFVKSTPIITRYKKNICQQAYEWDWQNLAVCMSRRKSTNETKRNETKWNNNIHWELSKPDNLSACWTSSSVLSKKRRLLTKCNQTKRNATKPRDRYGWQCVMRWHT